MEDEFSFLKKKESPIPNSIIAPRSSINLTNQELISPAGSARKRVSIREEFTTRRESIRIQLLSPEIKRQSFLSPEITNGYDESRLLAGKLMEKGMGVNDLIEERFKREMGIETKRLK
jgi:hypothetical protein